MTDDELIEELARAMQDQPDMSAREDLDEGDQDHMLSLARAILPIIKRETSRASDFQTAVAYDCGIRAGQEDERKAVVEWVKKDFYGGKRLADAIEAGEHRK